MEKQFNVNELISNALGEAKKNLKNVNILIAGKTGVGKSTLLNAVFDGKLADTGREDLLLNILRNILRKVFLLP